LTPTIQPPSTQHSTSI